MFKSIFSQKKSESLPSDLVGNQQTESSQILTQSKVTTTVRSDLSALSHLDPLATQALSRSQEETQRIRQQFIQSEQLLIGLLYDEKIFRLLEEFSVDASELSKDIQAKEFIGAYTGQPMLSKKSQEVFDQAYRDAKMRGSNFVSSEDVFLVLFSSEYPTAQYLQARGLKKELIVEKLSKTPNNDYKKRTLLERYGTDLTAAAREERLDPVAGRDNEINRIIHILLRRTKNNPIVIGETGVGKTAIIEGLAQKIVQGAVPKDLQDKRIFQLDVTSLIAGASHRGEFEERMRGVINEVLAASGKVILFIDEIHMILGTGLGDSEGVTASNIIKPYLSRGQLQLIGATTTVEYRKNFEKDKAFERRFQSVTTEEPNEEDAFAMLQVLRPKYEKFHRVTIPDDTLRECVRLSKKYIGERFLPDKAVDLLDEAASEVKLQVDGGKRKDNAIEKSDIERVVSGWTGIPITKLTEDESEKLLRLEERIHQRLIDQEEAVVAVAEAVRRGRIGLAPANRPISSFVFLGPTGVGKTELAKTLAEILFGRDDAMIRLDMSEYMEKHEVAKLIGAPPGYVGYEEGGQLTEAVRKKPYAIVLLDEIEKAHPDVFNVLLQLLEDGRLTDNKGNTVSFRNTIVICTSNIASNLIQQQLSTQDPKEQKSAEEHNKMYKEVMGIVQGELTKFFRPELLNRFDEVVIFKPLQPQYMNGIARLGIEKTAHLLKHQGYRLQITEKAIQTLASEGYDPVYGARPLRRLIQTTIENPIALAIIAKKFAPADTIGIDYNNSTNEFFFYKVSLGGSLTDEQWKDFLHRIARPDTVRIDSDRQFFTSLHDKVMQVSAKGNKTASLILAVGEMTSIGEIQTIRKELEEQSNQGQEVAKEILNAATAQLDHQRPKPLIKFKHVIEQITHEEPAVSPQNKDKFDKLYEKISFASKEHQPLAAVLMSINEATSDSEMLRLKQQLETAKAQGDPLATEILDTISQEVKTTPSEPGKEPAVIGQLSSQQEQSSEHDFKSNELASQTASN